MPGPALFDLAGKVAVVTGGGRGIGYGIAEGLARSGARVVLSGRTQTTLDEAAGRLREQGLDAAALTSDVSREEDVVVLRDSVASLFGTVDILVNNAGVNPIYRGIEKTSLADWTNIVGTNLTGVFLCCKYLGGLMAERGTGSVINISSVAGHVGLKRSVPYCAAKGGVELLTKALAIDWAEKGVRVNCIAPGFFETDLTAGMRKNTGMSSALLDRTPLGRFGGMNDIAGVAVFLASEAAAYVTGQSLLVDGGWCAE
ncbi:MAG: glucose 1-dehydrogenase [Acetobacteraceae bacterium]|nr:glucose 1-dehydrogenase [Acetobacteraceae bacterium]